MMVLDKQMELFPVATSEERDKAKYLLEKYVDMKGLIQDFEHYTQELTETTISGKIKGRIDDDELHSDKTANSVILSETQLANYRRYKVIIRQIERAYGLIRDAEAKQAVYLRYIQGRPYKETILFFKQDWSERTIERRIHEGVDAIADVFKVMDVYEIDWIKRMQILSVSCR